MEISYEMMIKIYNKHNPDSAKPDWVDKDLKDNYESLHEDFLNDLYGDKSKLEASEFKYAL